MKNKKFFIPLLIGLFALVACDGVAFVPGGGNSTSVSDTQSETESETETETETESESESEDPIQSTKLVDLSANNYIVGDNFSRKSKLYLRHTYESGATVDEQLINPNISNIKNLDENINIGTAVFPSAGNYSADVDYIVAVNGVNKSTRTTLNFKVRSLTEVNGAVLKSFVFSEEVSYEIGETLSSLNEDYAFEATWQLAGYPNAISERMLYKFKSNDISLKLFIDGGTTNVYNDVLDTGLYTLEASLKKFPSVIASKSFEISGAKGYYQLEESELTYSEFTSSSKPTGEANMAVIMLDFEPGSSDFVAADWTQSSVNQVYNYFFGNNTSTSGGWLSLKQYYEEVSKDKITVTGDVFGPLSFSSITMADITTNETRVSVLNAAVDYVVENMDVDWTQYDKNNDGYFDNLHFISNCVISESNVPWGSQLWPHQSTVYNDPGTPEAPKLRVYEISALDPVYFKDATTIIHEQGHMFGLPDYYDYSSSGADYVGLLDMQSGNVLDWNSWSKFSVGWANPYVIDGTKDVTKLTFSSATTTNQCVIIPANIDTYNNSAFDEFFLIELITKEGNNAQHWSYVSASENAGVRLYHVDARLWNTNTGALIDNPTDAINGYKNGYYVELRTTNTTTFGDYASVARKADHDFKTLALIQQGGVDTFGQQNKSARHQLNTSDLFLTGDTFDFETYKHFLSKSGKTVTSMDNGETFPYSIYFNYVGKDGCTITVSKI